MSARIDLPETEWLRVSPKQVGIELASGAVGLLLATLVATVPLFLGQSWGWFLLVPVITVGVVSLAVTPRRVRSIGYQLRRDDLLLRRGILFTRFVAVPYGRMQLVDVTRGPLARALGLASLRFVTAAAASNISLDGLTEADAIHLRDHLIELAESRRAGL
jgi:hypothetical protein